MIKRTLTASVLLALGSLPTLADTTDKNWVGASALYYNADHDNISEEFLDDGFGVSVEAGFRFSPKWAVRLELAHLNVRSDNDLLGDDQTGQLFGVDALYFLKDDVAYLFGGIKSLNLVENTSLFNIGVGKHWELNDKLNLITEVANYRDFGSDFNDFGVKLGLAYTFGDVKAPAKPIKSNAPVDGDADKDGVLDSKDRCPGTKAGTTVDNNGCALVIENDSDKDGVLDSVDTCPETPAGDLVDSNGCTRFGTETVSETVAVLFANNSAEITNKSASDIVDFAAFLKRYGNTDAVIEGHASAPGAADYNLKLSSDRAEAFKTLLVEEYDIDATRLKAVGYGETQLLDTSNTAAANAKNRRIVVNVSETVKVKLTK